MLITGKPDAAANESNCANYKKREPVVKSKAPAAAFDKLRWWRVEMARAHNVPAYVIFVDATLREITKAKPASLDDLRGVSGVGDKKLVTYGDDIVRLIAEMV